MSVRVEESSTRYSRDARHRCRDRSLFVFVSLLDGSYRILVSSFWGSVRRGPRCPTSMLRACVVRGAYLHLPQSMGWPKFRTIAIVRSRCSRNRRTAIDRHTFFYMVCLFVFFSFRACCSDTLPGFMLLPGFPARKGVRWFSFVSPPPPRPSSCSSGSSASLRLALNWNGAVSCDEYAPGHQTATPSRRIAIFLPPPPHLPAPIRN